VPPLHIVAVWAGTTGVGSNVTVTVKVPPVQLPETGVTVYVAVCTVFVVLDSVPEIFVAPLPEAPPENPVPDGADQLYVVLDGTIPSVPLTGVTVNADLLHTVVVIAFMDGIGFTVTVTVNVAPTQEPASPEVGVTVYVAVATLLVVLVSVPEIFEAPLPEVPPVNPLPEGADQLYFVPDGMIVVG
jgi:hypothetical protein